MKLEYMKAKIIQVEDERKPVIRESTVFNELNYSSTPPPLDISH